MAITRVGVAEVAPTTSTSSALPIPAGTQDGDVAIVRFHREDTTAVLPPAGQGYTRVDPIDSISTGGVNADTIFVAVLQNADASLNHTFTHLSTWRQVQAIFLRGVDRSDIMAIRDPAVATNGTGTSATTPSESDPSLNGFWLLLSMCSWDNATMTFPGTINGNTLTTEYGGLSQNLGLARAEYSSSAAISSAAVTLGSAPINWLGKTVAIRPDTGGVMAPYVFGAGTAVFTATSGATLSPTRPVGWTDDDIFIVLAHRSDNTAMTSLSGYTQISAANNTTAQRVEVWARRAVSGDSAPVITFGTGTVVRGAQLYVIRGVDPSIALTSLQVVRNNNAASLTVTFPTITPSENRSMLLALFAYEDDPPSAPQMDLWTDFVVNASALGSDMALGYAWRTYPVSGIATGALTTLTAGPSSPNVGIMIAFPPPVSSTHTDSSVAGVQPAATGTLAYTRGYNRAVAGAQPAPVGALARKLSGVRSLAGNQPAANGTVSRALSALRSVAGLQPSSTGSLSRRLAALRSLVGVQPSATGTLARSLGRSRSLTGIQPAATGVLDATVVFLRTLSGTQPAASGTVSRILSAARTVTGSQPASTGTLARRIAVTRFVAGSQPSASGTLTALATILRTVTGVQPAATGALARKLSALRTLSGTQPAATGTLTRIKSAVRSLVGVQPAATGVLTRAANRTRSLAGVQPSSTGTVTAQATVSRTVVGNQPAAAGTLTRKLIAVRSLFGVQPAATGVLTRFVAATRSVVGVQPAATGTVTRIANRTRSLSGAQPAPTGALARLYATTRLVAGTQPSAIGTVSRSANYSRSLGGVQPAMTSSLTYTGGRPGVVPATLTVGMTPLVGVVVGTSELSAVTVGVSERPIVTAGASELSDVSAGATETAQVLAGVS